MGSAASVGTLVEDAVRAEVLQPRQIRFRLSQEVAFIVGRNEGDLAERAAGLADRHAERPEAPELVAALVEQLDDGLVALDRVARHHVARRLGARDGALEGVGAGGVGHVGELLGALAVVLEGRRVVASRVGPGALGVDARKRRDGVRVLGHRNGCGCRRVVRGRRCRVLRSTDAGVALCPLRAVRLRQCVMLHQYDSEDNDERGCNEQPKTLQKLHLSYS